MSILEFEKPILEISKKIEEIEKINKESPEPELQVVIDKLQKKLESLKQKTYSNLDYWEKTLLSRHPKRFNTYAFLEIVTTDFIELHGDRHFLDDHSIIGGLCRIEGTAFMVIGQQKGRNTKENVYRNFGMPMPEGYRKAIRLMKLAEKFKIPVVSFIDTPGAYPGIDAEKRNQSGAIARNLIEMSDLTVPFISIILGEGGSGGALALAVSDVILMLEHSIFSVISPEGCSSILWKDTKKTQEAAKRLKYTAQDLLNFEIIDSIIPEPLGGSHTNYQEIGENIKKEILDNYKKLNLKTKEELIEERYLKFRKMGTKYIS